LFNFGVIDHSIRKGLVVGSMRDETDRQTSDRLAGRQIDRQIDIHTRIGTELGDRER